MRKGYCVTFCKTVCGTFDASIIRLVACAYLADEHAGMLVGCRGFACGCAPRCFGLRPRRRLRLPRPCPRSRPRDFWAVSQEMGVDFAMDLDFCAVFGGVCSLSALPTWGNAGVLWRFGPVRPAKPPRSCKRGSRVARGGQRAPQDVLVAWADHSESYLVFRLLGGHADSVFGPGLRFFLGYRQSLIRAIIEKWNRTSSDISSHG